MRKRHWTVAGLQEWVRSRLYRPSGAVNPAVGDSSRLPGRLEPVVEAFCREPGTRFGGELRLFFSITCNDDIAFLREADIVPATQGTFLGDYRVRQQQAACRDWPKVSMPPDTARRGFFRTHLVRLGRQ
jgi:hypothetical protein